MKRVIPVLIVFTMFLVLTCGKPNVKHTAIGGEAGTTELWAIDYEYRLVNVAIDSVLKIDKDRKSFQKGVEESSDKYINNLRHDLSTAGLIFSDTRDAAGKIHLELQWKSKKETDLTNYAAQRNDPLKETDADLERRGIRTDDSLSIDPGPAFWKMFADDFYLSRAVVSLESRDGKDLGRVYITEEGRDHIEPEFVAEVISKIISEGEY